MGSKHLLIPSEKMQDVLHQLFLKFKFSEEKARLMADVFTENSLAGVYSHGINRVGPFIQFVKEGLVNVDAEAEKSSTFGSIERWDGNFGPGIINATKCTNRAIELAKLHGMGLVALRNTNHWMRGGYYGWQTAKSGCIGILFTNTLPNMPPWGGKESRIGNNPFIISIPRADGHVVLDMAISQFSFGKINEYQQKGEQLPFPGGWDENDTLTTDPKKIMSSLRGVPIGYWKGSALSMVLDMLATLLSAGDSTCKISQREQETGISQIFICIDPERFNDKNIQEKLLREIIDYTHNVEPMRPNDKIYYPGERSSITREKNLKDGIPVSEGIWNTVINL